MSDQGYVDLSHGGHIEPDDDQSEFQAPNFEQRDLEDRAARDLSLRRKGICSHSWYKSNSHTIKPTGGAHKPAKCLHCGQEFPTEADLLAERERLLEEEASA